MKHHDRLFRIAISLLVVGTLLIGVGALIIIADRSGAFTTSSSSDGSLNQIAQICHARDNAKLPDKRCTPGAADPRVTQANIHKTICVRGYTKTVRPSVTYTNNLKLAQIRQYGYSDTNPHDYEEDHLISLELGGDPSNPANLWPEPGASPNAKDRIENLLHARLCAGGLTLSQAQLAISTNWTTIR